MKTTEVTVVRIYLNEKEGQLESLLRRLHDWEKVRGVTVFRGISGFGASGEVHSARLLDLSLNLPVVVEFFDAPDKVASIIEHIHTSIKPGHIIHWTAYVNEDDDE
jgi:PII-like signaling protein